MPRRRRRCCYGLVTAAISGRASQSTGPPLRQVGNRGQRSALSGPGVQRIVRARCVVVLLVSRFRRASRPKCIACLRWSCSSLVVVCGGAARGRSGMPARPTSTATSPSPTPSATSPLPKGIAPSRAATPRAAPMVQPAFASLPSSGAIPPATPAIPAARASAASAMTKPALVPTAPQRPASDAGACTAARSMRTAAAGTRAEPATRAAPSRRFAAMPRERR